MGSEAVATSLSCRLSGLRVILQSLYFSYGSPGMGPTFSQCRTVCKVPHQGLVLVPKAPHARLRCHRSDKGHGVCSPL